MELIEVLKGLKDNYLKNKKELGVHSENDIIEMVATSEIFDISNLPIIKQDCSIKTFNEKYYYVTSETISNLSLPFTNNIVKTGVRQMSMFTQQFETENYVHISEIEPHEYIGSIIFTMEHEKKHIIHITPFKIINEKIIMINKEKESKEEMTNALTVIHKALNIINNLPKHKTYSFTPKEYKTEYYRRKNASTIKITNRPIYYVLESKSNPDKIRVNHNQGYLKCEYSFRVRGHWRALHNSESIGVNRDNKRIVKGYTWIREYIKGDGELVKRVRLVK